MFRGSAAVLLLPFWLFASAIAPLHVHEGDADGHSRVVVHRHFNPHESIAHETDGTEVESGERTVWLDASIIQGAAFHLDAPLAVLTRVSEPTQIWTPSWALTFDDGAPAHGPPGSSTALRAPPALPV